MNKYLFDFWPLISILLGILICVVVLLILRGFMLWYWKINQVLKNQEQQTALLTQLYRKQNRNTARASYYTHRAMGDNARAHHYLLQMVFEELGNTHLKADDHKTKYNNLKAQYSPLFKVIGFEFPEYMG